MSHMAREEVEAICICHDIEGKGAFSITKDVRGSSSWSLCVNAWPCVRWLVAAGIDPESPWWRRVRGGAGSRLSGCQHQLRYLCSIDGTYHKGPQRYLPTVQGCGG